MSEGEFTTDWMPVEDSRYRCQPGSREGCGSQRIEYRAWEDEQGHEDYQYRCKDCGKQWWAEGTDA